MEMKINKLTSLADKLR